MTGWRHHTGKAAVLPMENIDTDQLIPARFMSTPRKDGYGNYLLHDLRFDEIGTPKEPPWSIDGTSVLVARRNFGCGSSREAAVYALVDFGIQAVIAPSFGDIFAGNAVNNGLLPAQIDEAFCDALLSGLAADQAELTVDLEASEITLGELRGAFTLDSVWRLKLINGWDDIDLTASRADAIDAFAADYRVRSPWTWPADASR
ncbi:MAG: 3-isopropylmalate dehydratase small subunit [Geminicoccaceae bacterium]